MTTTTDPYTEMRERLGSYLQSESTSLNAMEFDSDLDGDEDEQDRIRAERMACFEFGTAAMDCVARGSLLTAMCLVAACEGASSYGRQAFWNQVQDDLYSMSCSEFGASLRNVNQRLIDWVDAGRQMAEVAEIVDLIVVLTPEDAAQ